MHHARHRKRAHERARAPEQRAAGLRPKDDEDMPEKLVPAEAPELRDGRGCPRAVGERRPAPGGLAEEDAAYERREVVERVDGRVHHHASAQREECPPGAARDRAQGRIEDGVACGDVDRGPEMLHEVVGDVERYEFEEQLA